MVEKNVPLVEHIVNRVMARLPSNHDRSDLVQTGTVGLITAVQRFDPEAGTTFSTFAGRRIEGAIIDQLRRTDWAPRSVRALERRIRAAEDDAGPRADRDRIVAEALGLDDREMTMVRQDVAKARVDSLDRPAGDQDDQSTIAATVADNVRPIDEALEEKELLGYLRSAIHLLPERHRVVVVGYFFDGRSMTELGELLGVTQSRASQLKDESLTMIRNGIEHSYQNEPAPDAEPAKAPSRRQQAFNDAMAAPRPWSERINPYDAAGRI